MNVRRTLLVHAAVYLLVAGLLLWRALPVNWDTPTNLDYQEGWASLTAVVAVVFGSVQGLLWGRDARAGGLLACLIGAAVAFAGAGFYLDGPIANGDEVWTAGREQVVMSQLVWAGYWLAQTLVATLWILSLGSRLTILSAPDGPCDGDRFDAGPDDGLPGFDAGGGNALGEEWK